MIDQYKSIFQKFKISKADEKLFNDLVESSTTMEELDKVINLFMSKYVSPSNRALNNLILDTLNISMSRELTLMQYSELQTVFTLSSRVYEDTLKTNFAIISNLILPSVNNMIGGDRFIQEQLVNNLIESFDNRILGAMANTRGDVLNHVRTLQREMIIRNQQYIMMKENGVLDSIIEKEKARFKQDMLKKYPQLEKMLNDGRILKSKTYKDSMGNDKFKTYTLDDYTEMSVSETLKNVDRDAVELTSKYYGEPVVEFYLADNRHVEEANHSCKYIMNNCKLYGKVLLATTEYYAKLFGIWSIDKAKSQNSLNISWHCRHSIRRAPEEIINKLQKLIAIQQLTDQEV